MLNSKKIVRALLALLMLSFAVSCSAPAYKQNKYKSGKRFRDCGCYKPELKPNTALSYYEQK